MGHIRYDIPPLPERKGAQLLYVTTSVSDSSWQSILHTHANAELFYCISGEGRFQLDEGEFAVHTDDLVVVNPHQRHTEYSQKNTHLEYIVLGVNGCEFTRSDGESLTYRAMNYSSNRRSLLPLFHEIVFEASTNAAQSAEACQYLLEVLLIRLRRHEQFDMAYKLPEHFASTECLTVKRYIDDHYSDELDLDALSALTHLSKFYLAHAFQKEFGISPISYLLQIRLREARALLTRYDHRMSDISRILGFSSQSYFCQCFKRETGMTPSAYRQASRASKETPRKA